MSREEGEAVHGLGLSLTEELDDATVAVFLLERSGRIVECNERARQLLAADGGLADDGGQLGASSAQVHEALHAALADATTNSGTGSASVRVPTADQGRWLLAQVRPVRRRAEPLSDRAAVAVVVRDPWARKKVDPNAVQQALGLTAAEAEVAALLAEGRTVTEIAAARHRTVASVRWHLRQVYSKTGLRGQADLVRALLAVVGA